MIKQGISENPAKIVYLGIGSNLGNKRINIEKAKFFLQEYPIKIQYSSSYYETFSLPNPNHPKFLNIVVKIETTLNPKELFFIIGFGHIWVHPNMSKNLLYKNILNTLTIKN